MAEFKDLARDIEKTRKKLIQAKTNVNKQIAADVLNYAKYFSGGKWRGPGHPYSVKNPGPIPYGDPAIINTRSGVFKRSWVIYTTLSMPDGSKIPVIANIASYASYLQYGTSKMIARPLDKVLEDRIKTVSLKFVEDEMQRVFQDSFLARK